MDDDDVSNTNLTEIKNQKSELIILKDFGPLHSVEIPYNYHVIMLCANI